MADRTKIEWTRSDDGSPGATWNPVTGCTQVGPGCDHCYALTLAERFRGAPNHYFEHGFDVTLRPDKLDQPLRWKRPRKVFVNSMSDLFHSEIPGEYIARVFAVMALAPRHTFQVLTKRHGRMRSLLSSPAFEDQVRAASGVEFGPDYHGAWPLPNVWLGVTVEDQKRADLRVPALLETPAAVRFLSCEPLLGPVQIGHYLAGIDWVIVGGESGRGARPMHPGWVRTIRDDCSHAGAAFHFKQWGEWVTEDQAPEDITLPGISWRHFGDDAGSYKVGKKAAGRELDGRTWDEYPDAARRLRAALDEEPQP